MRFWKNTKPVLLLLFFVLAVSGKQSLQAQEMWGIVSSNYAGSNSTLINPSFLVNSRLYQDINMLAGDFFFENNAVNINKSDYRLFRLFGPDAEIPSYGEDGYIVDIYNNKDLKYAYSSIHLRGPSFMQVRGDQAYAVHTGFRSIVDNRNLPYEIANFAYYGLDYTPQHNINYQDEDFKIANIQWAEIGASYSRVLYKYGLNRYSGGVTVKGLMGIAGGYFVDREIDYVVLNDSTINVRNLDASIGYALPVDYNNNDLPVGPLFKGWGVALDLGFTYTRTKMGHQNRKFSELCMQTYPDYLYKIGISLVDLGTVSFGKNARLHEYNDVGALWEEIDTLNFDNLDQVARMASEKFYGDPDASLSGEKISILTPAAVSAQFDYQFIPNWYINTVVILPITLGPNNIQRPAQVAVVPRFESRLFEFSIPISLYEMRKPRIGVAARFGFLTLGTDNLGGFLPFSDFTGMDFYFSVKLNFPKGYCGRFGRRVGCQNQEYGVNREN
jgi:hypothetical protein